MLRIGATIRAHFDVFGIVAAYFSNAAERSPAEWASKARNVKRKGGRIDGFATEDSAGTTKNHATNRNISSGFECDRKCAGRDGSTTR